MGANHGDGVAGLPFVADSESDDGGCVTGEVVLASGLEGGCPRVALLVGVSYWRN
jgi:hypothetical protein